MDDREGLARDILRAAGWYPGRKVDVDAWLLKLVKMGYDVTPNAYQLLEEFGSLVVPFGVLQHPAGIGLITFDPMEAVDYFDHDQLDLEDWQHHLNTSLTPVARIAESGVLLADRRGGIYRTFYREMYYVSTGGYDSLVGYLIVESADFSNLQRLAK